jgi:ElaB/YqjD/DUF883 family membrane-anchored ribosome-binding protein
MNTDIHSKSPIDQLPETVRGTAQRAAVAAKDATAAVEDFAKDTYQTLSSKVEEGVERTKEYAQHAADVTRDTANRATGAAKDMCQSAVTKAGDTLETTKEYARQNPVTVVLGAVAFGAALGYMLMMARRKPTFSERYAEEPLVAVREAILGALAPVSQRVRHGYDSARDGAGKVIDQVQNIGSERTCDSFSDQIGRIGNNLKFW